jgi:dienelactone hydrolase
MRRLWAVRVALAVLLSIAGARGQSILRQELRIPIHGAGSKGLAAVMVRPNEAGPHPLVVLTHGSPRNAEDRSQMSPLAMLPQAIEFARRGWTAVVVMRRGYGDSGGGYAERYGQCSSPFYEGAGIASAADLRASIEYLSKLPEVDASRILSVGVSAGGFANVALSANPPPGLVAAISFAGGRGSLQSDQVCSPEALIEAFADFGKKSRIPMLWVYSENDHFFAPQLAGRFYQAFTAAGGKASFISAPAFGADGHFLFSRKGIPIWASMVDDFLKTQNLTLRAELLPAPEPPKIAPPAELSFGGKEEFREYLLSPPHKAFAASVDGHYGFSFGRRTEQDAISKALFNCGQVAAGADRCSLVMLDDQTQGK